jgi:RHS repeat-associated protein
MTSSWVRFLACMVCGLVSSTVGWSTAAWAEESSPSTAMSLTSNPLILPGPQSFAAGQQVAAEEARRASPEAVTERAVSRTEYEDVHREAAVALAEHDFGIGRPSWTSPEGQGSGHITKYVGNSSAVETLPNGKHVFVESTIPLLSNVGSGQSAPTSLSLRDNGESYDPSNPLVPISISKVPSGGVSLPLGISVVPTEALAPEGSVVAGNKVVYPGTAPDTDFMVEPLPGGVEASWQLRSEASPQENSLRFALPAGVSLRLSTTVPGGAELVSEGQVLATIPPATAVQADGSPLAVSYTVNGDVLTTHVDLSGSVAFPVLLDPVVLGTFGSYGAGTWTGWTSSDNCGTGCYGFFASASQLLSLIANAPWPAGYAGWWSISAPGYWTTNGARITRVDLTGVNHDSEQSSMTASFAGDSGGSPVYTFNGLAGAEGSLPYSSKAVLSGRGMALCAQNAGGHDGGEQPLCNESYGAETLYLGNEVNGWTSVYNWTEITGAVVRYIDNTPPNKVALVNVPEDWWQYGPSNLTYLWAQDEGLGIEAATVEIPPGKLNSEGRPFFSQEFGCASEAGFNGCPQEQKSSYIDLSGLATGVYTLGATAYDAAGNFREEQPNPKIYIDHTPPKFTSFGGSLYEANNGIIGNGNFNLTFSAEDGSTSAPQSGMLWLGVSVDGKRVSEVKTTCPYPTGVPASNCFGLSGNWTMEGQKYGAGSHTISVTAEDWAGNLTTETFHVTINEAPYETMGPGSVNIKTGDYKLTTTDFSITSPGASLALTRSYDSRLSTQGVGGPLGPQWTLGLPDLSANGIWQNLKVLTTGGVQATLANGTPIIFALSGSTYTSPPGYQTDTLAKTSSSPLEYRITDGSGNATIFTRASSSEETEPVLIPTGAMQATATGGLNKVTYSFTKTSEGIIEPTKMLAPYPSTINCVKEHPEELVAGCREVTFNYATSTTATGEGASEWGDYTGRLTRAYLTAWNPATKAMATTTIAQYAYDTKGRLRAEWDPRISPALKTEYGYDPEGHITSMTPPGQETWAFTYGTIAGDSNTGRLLKVLEAPASTALWNGQATKYTEAPHLSGSPVVGTRMTVAHGVWSPAPVAYAYQWQDCNKTGEECAPIPGATNPGYAVASSDLGHTIRAQVAATNGGGSTFASVITSTVNTALTSEYSQPSGSGPFWIVTGPDKNLWSTDYATNKIAKITPSGSITEYALPAGSAPRGIVSGPDGNLWFTDLGTSKIGKITTTGTITEYGLPAGSEPWGITEGADKNLWFTNIGTNKIGKITTAGTISEVALPAGSAPYGIASGPDGKLWFADQSSNKIGNVPTSGTPVIEYSLPAGSAPFGIATGPDGNLWFTEYGTSKIGKITTTGSVSEYALPSGSAPRGITTGPDGNLWFANLGTSKVGELPPSWKGPYADSSSSGYQLAPTGGITYPAAGPKTGSTAITLDGSSGYLASTSTGAGSTREASGVTLEAWIKPNNVADGSYQEIISKTYVGQIDIPPGVNHIRALFGNGVSWVASAEGGELVAGQWAHIAATYNGSVARIYVNGALVATGAVANYAFGSYPYPLVVGAYDYAGPTIGGYFWGSINNPTVYNQALTQTQIQADYNATTQEAYETLVLGHTPAAYYPFTSRVNELSILASSEQRGIATGPEGNMWVAGLNTSKIAKIALKPSEGETLTPEPGTTIEYKVPLSGSGLPTMTKTEVEKWGQKDIPVEAAAIFPPDEAQSWPASDYKRATIYYLDSTNRAVNVSSPTGGISTSEYEGHDNQTRELTAANRATALKEAKPAEAAEHLSTTFAYNTEGAELNSSLGAEHKIKLPSGSEVQARKQVTYKYDEGAPIEGGPYRLVTSTKEAALVAGKEEDARTITKSYSGGSNLGWKLHEPTATIIDPTGLKLTYNTVYSSTTGAVTETQMPGGGTGNVGAHTSQIVYYTPAKEASVAVCQNHPEWANMPCQAQPAHQPEAGGLPNLPVTTFTYNMLDEAEITKSTSGEAVRTDTQTYDSEGRLASRETTSTTGGALPKVTDEYNSETGLLTKQKTGTGAEERKITSAYNTVGQLTSYTDADGVTAAYEYENGKDERLKAISDGKGGQTYTYEENTGELTGLTDTATGAFQATYDPEGKLLTEKLPDGLTANVTYNAANEQIGLEYHKASNCGVSCTWFNDTAVPSIHGQWMSQNSSFATQNYAYDASGRLTQVQSTPTGKGCTTRTYSYDPDGNRTVFATFPPAIGGKCTNEGGTAESHAYDTADRLLDTGTEYNPFGDIKTLNAADAGGSKLTSQYYVDGQVESQTQGEQTVGYDFDPGRRIREVVSTGKITATEIENYSGPGANPSWSSEPSGSWTRSIAGISDSLDAIQRNGETPVLQIANLHGDIVATAYNSETPTTLASTIGEANEYGVPATEAPPKYSWLGAHELPTELPSGVTAMGSRSYIPQLGRFLQPDPSPGGSANAYAYTHGNPVNETDLSGAWTLNETSGGVSAVSTGEGTQVAGGTGVAAGAIMPLPVNTQIEEAANANPPWDQVTAGDEEYEEYEGEEGEESEYASYRPGSKGQQEAQTESAILYQPLGEAALGSEGTPGIEGVSEPDAFLPLCTQGSDQPCTSFVSSTKRRCFWKQGCPKQTSPKGRRKKSPWKHPDPYPSQREEENCARENRENGGRGCPRPPQG